jgi:high-affinity iron transporter
LGEGAFYASAVIAFREAFEALLISSIVYLALRRLGRRAVLAYVLAGGLLALATAALIVLALGVALAGLQGPLIEAVLSLVAAGVVFSVVYWLARTGPRIARSVEARALALASGWAVAGLIFIVVFREALETILMVAPFAVRAFHQAVGGVLAGVVAATALSLLVWVVGVRLPLSTFFRVTSTLLILIASGLAGYGVHELVEYLEASGYELGWLAQRAYDLGLPEDHPLHHEAPLGSILAALTGYSSYMEWARLTVQLGALALGAAILARAYR